MNRTARLLGFTLLVLAGSVLAQDAVVDNSAAFGVWGTKLGEPGDVTLVSAECTVVVRCTSAASVLLERSRPRQAGTETGRFPMRWTAERPPPGWPLFSRLSS
jgi:hypothetical protein